MLAAARVDGEERGRDEGKNVPDRVAGPLAPGKVRQRGAAPGEDRDRQRPGAHRFAERVDRAPRGAPEDRDDLGGRAHQPARAGEERHAVDAAPFDDLPPEALELADARIRRRGERAR